MCGPHFPVRHNLDEGGCSMKITEDVRKYATEHGLTNTEAIESCMEAVTQPCSRGARPGFPKRKEFVEQGSEVYAKT